MCVMSFENYKNLATIIMQNTINRLLKQLEEHEKQIEAIRKVLPALQGLQQTVRLPPGAMFEVHFQCYWPDQCSVKTLGFFLSQAFLEAVALWKEHNAGSERPYHGQAEVFFSMGDLRVPVSREDALRIVQKESTNFVFLAVHFGEDKRLLGEISKAVWGKDDVLPGWYANNVTKHKPAEVASAC